MVEPEQPQKSADKKQEFSDTIGKRAEQKLRGRAKKGNAAWFGLGMFGLVGWSVAIPTLIGIAIGLWLDRRWPGEVSWTLTLLIIGVTLGCINAWYWVKQESRRD